MSVTMADIAKTCGVSMMTVSRVLSGKGSVSPKTREKVLEAARAQNFTVNSIASNFARRRSNFLGIVAPMDRIVGTHYWAQIWHGIQSVLKKTAYDLAVFDYYSPDFAHGQRVQSLYHSRKVDGIFSITPPAEDEFLDTTYSQRIPLVVLGKPVANPSICTVNCDDYHGVTSLCEHLYNEGHRRMAFIAGPTEWSLAQLRAKAFQDFCQSHHLRIPKRFHEHSEYTQQSGFEAAMRLLEPPHPPTAIIAGNDNTALGVIKCVRHLKLRIPEDISIASCNDYPQAQHTEPPLTSIHQPLFEMAQKGAQHLLDALESGEAPQGHYSLETTLVIRQSTAPIC